VRGYQLMDKSPIKNKQIKNKNINNKNKIINK